MPPFEPQHPHLRLVWSRLTETGRASRLRDAQRREAILEAVAARPVGESERKAIVRIGDGTDRSTFRRWQKRYRELGFDGLVDGRMPDTSPMPPSVREAICTLRRADRDCSVAAIIAHVAEHHGFKVGGTKVRAVLRQAGLSRRSGPPSGGEPELGTQRLELAGMKLLEAASVETGYLGALGEAVVAQGEAAVESRPKPGAADRQGRDREGRFEAAYNEQYRKAAGATIGPGFASVESKRPDKEPARFHVNRVSAANVEQKLWALMVSPLLGSGRWDGIRVPRGELLGELCGYPYMPATLDQFTRELKYLGLSSTLWEVHARLWYDQSASWGEARTALVLYIDETNKAVWTSLFSESSKVSAVGRVMPALEVVAFHSGYGVPLWQVTRSGRAPLVREVPPLLSQMKHILGGAEVGRIVVIDAESNSIPFLRGLEIGPTKHAWVTRLRPSWIESKRIFNRTNYRPYRDGDRIRVGVADFPIPRDAEHPDGGLFRMRVVEIERRTKGTTTYLGASQLLSDKEWTADEIADLYFDRWPNQEANFRAVNQAVGAKEVHGYGKQLVDNVSVVTELDELRHECGRLEATAAQLKPERDAAVRGLRAEEVELARRTRRLDTVTGRIDAAIARGARVTPALQRLSAERKELTGEIARQRATVARQEKGVGRLTARAETTARRLSERRAHTETLESRRQIFRHDVELDSLFAVLKVGLVLLVTFVLKEYLGDARMEPATFLERVATLPGRLRLLPDLEILTFEYNRRDAEVMALLATHVDAINARELRTRSGRVLRIEVEPAPPPRRPPPAGGRVNSARRFAR
jgi:transposase